MTTRHLLVCGSVLLLLGTRPLAGRADGPPYSPAESMATMQLEAGYRIELVAAEPDIQSPVAMDFDEQGRLFVVEMPGYPLDTRPTGRVKLLEDADGDGRADVRTVVVTGFAVTNPQHMVNGPVYGLDNWIHLAHEGPAHAVIY